MLLLAQHDSHNFGFKQNLNFETVSLSDLDWISKWNYWIEHGFGKSKYVHLFRSGYIY